MHVYIIFLNSSTVKSLDILGELQIEGAKITSLFSEAAVLPQREAFLEALKTLALKRLCPKRIHLTATPVDCGNKSLTAKIQISQSD